MAARLNPYLNFDGQSAEAMTFYQQVLGGELNISRFGDFGETPPGVDPDGTMHAMLETPDGFTLMASDMPLEPQMWGDIFGMVIDKFGTAWMVNIAGPSAQG